MNYLALVQDVHRESASGGTAPSTLVGVSGENLRLTKWVREADNYIQESFVDWKFLWSQDSITLVPGTYLYTPPGGDLGAFDRKTFKINGEPIGVVDYLEVKSSVRETSQGAVWRAVIMPDGTIRTDLTPAAADTLTYDYWVRPTELAVDGDVSAIPERFHRAIVGKALMSYAEYEGAPEIMELGKRMYSEWLLKLRSDQLPGDRYMHNKAEDNEMTIVTE